MANGLALPEGFSVEPTKEQELFLPEGFTLRPPKDEKQNFFERFGDDLMERFGKQGGEIIGRRVAGEQGFASTAIQLTGKVGAGTIIDFIGEAMISGGRGLAFIAGEDLTNSVKESATKAGVYLLNTEKGKAGIEAALQGQADWMDYKEKNPIWAENIEALVNVGLLITPIKKRPSTQTRLGNKLAKPLDVSAARLTLKQKKAFVDDLIKPKETIKTLEDATRRTKEIGSLGTKVTTLTDGEKRIATEIMKIPGVSPKKTLQGNLNVISAAQTKKHDALKSQLSSLGGRGVYSADDLAKHLKNTTGVLIRDTAILKSGGMRRVADDTVDTALKQAAKNPRSLSGLLQARKDFRSDIEKQFPKIHDSASNAQKLVFDDVSREMNRFIASRVPLKKLPIGSRKPFTNPEPVVRIEKSLYQQHQLLNGMKNIGEKAAKEGRNKIARAIQSLLRFIPIRNELIAALSVMYGMGGLGAAGTFGPLIQKVAFGYGIVAGTKGLIMAPGSRAGIAKLIRLLDRRIKVTNDIQTARELRLHRAALAQLIEDSTVSKEAEEYREAQ